MYIDPAAGSLVIQVIVAGVVSALAAMTRVRRAISSFLASLFSRRSH